MPSILVVDGDDRGSPMSPVEMMVARKHQPQHNIEDQELPGVLGVLGYLNYGDTVTSQPIHNYTQTERNKYKFS